MSEDGIKDGGVDSGYGATLSQSSGGSMEGRTDEVPEEDEEPETTASPSVAQETETETTTTTEPEPSSQEEPDFSTSTSVGAAGATSDDVPWDLSDHAQEILAEASPRDYEMPDTGQLPYIHARSKPVTKGLDTIGVRVRPELKSAVNDAIDDAEEFYESDESFDTDYFEAALTVALWHHDEVLALMGELGYGMGE